MNWFKKLFSFKEASKINDDPSHEIESYEARNALLEKYDVKFAYNKYWGKVIECDNAISSYLFTWRDREDIDNFLYDVNLILEGKYELIQDPFYNNDLLGIIGYLEPNQITITGSYPDPFIVPMADFKELLLSWRAYLLS